MHSSFQQLNYCELCFASGAIAAPSPHMKSGAVLALSRLIFEFRDGLPEDTVREAVATVGLLLQDKSREVVQSVLGFVKVGTTYWWIGEVARTAGWRIVEL